jgi:hypothetical protein
MVTDLGNRNGGGRADVPDTQGNGQEIGGFFIADIDMGIGGNINGLALGNPWPGIGLDFGHKKAEYKGQNHKIFDFHHGPPG